MAQPGQTTFGVARIVATALPSGVVILWIVAWILTRGGQQRLSAEVMPPELALVIWAVLAMVGFAAAIAARGRALQATRSLRGLTEAEERAKALQRVLTNLVLAWALLEGPALLSGVFFLLLGTAQILLLAVPLYLVGVALTFPRPEWFGETRSRLGG